MLDIEGTTTPIAFVHQTLFGYARARVSGFLERHWSDPEVRADVARLEAEHAAESPQPGPPPWHDEAASIVSYVHWLMDQDRKSTGLKSLQGKIWEEGYQSGDLRGEVYPDVPPALAVFAARRGPRVTHVQHMTRRRDRLRYLHPLLRRAVMGVAGHATFRAHYRPLLSPP